MPLIIVVLSIFIVIGAILRFVISVGGLVHDSPIVVTSPWWGSMIHNVAIISVIVYFLSN